MYFGGVGGEAGVGHVGELLRVVAAGPDGVEEVLAAAEGGFGCFGVAGASVGAGLDELGEGQHSWWGVAQSAFVAPSAMSAPWSG